MTQSTIVSLPQVHMHDSNDEILFNNQSSSYNPLRNSRVSKNAPSKNTISFRNIKYVLGNEFIYDLREFWCVSPFKSKTKPKPILDDIAGIFKSGINAIMGKNELFVNCIDYQKTHDYYLGPTGCGKSSLIDVLAGRKDPKGLSGDIFLDGLPISSSFKYMSGYVIQEDILSGTLTVKENIMFSLNTRHRTKISKQERRDRVEEVIEDLGLTKCADTRIGTEFIRGVSGGERKRTCIGMELILQPKILFLDEPTTGLDATTAQQVIELLKKLSKSGRTIIFSIHQPRFSIFNLFDQVVLMCKGKIVYNDSPENVLPYFRKQGFERDTNDNPANFLLDILIEANQDGPEGEKKLASLIRNYQRTTIYQKIPSEIDEQLREASFNMDNNKNKIGNKSIFKELYYISKRTVINTIRHPLLFLSQIVVAVFVGLLIGLAFFNIPKTVDPGVQNRLGAIFMIVSSKILSTVTAIEPLIKERPLFIHEVVSGYYRIPTFFVIKIIWDILALRFVPSIIYSVIVYFMTGLQRTAEKFFIFLLTIFMCSLFGSAICFFFSALIPLFAVALVIVVLIFVVMMIFSGFIVDLASLYSWIAWLKWLSAFRYASNLLTINEFRDITFCLANMTSVCPTNGTNILKNRQIDYQTGWDRWLNIVVLAAMAVAFYVLAFIQLIRMKKTK
ncbi:unnamed protein product [Adineta steineri]|uniref:ABC transporter domain-containing protein n=1 Tax=Adineta steineri TaxID=433720 RepID=A0A814TVF0_9BILA|nr:unnamed protein product [Adineta steineri]CAF3588681.1 unnamed protein product [Adineta steineri]